MKRRTAGLVLAIVSIGFCVLLAEALLPAVRDALACPLRSSAAR